MSSLSNAVQRLKRELPGWWFTLGECSVSCDATIGPDVAYCPKWMLDAYDGGFDCDIRQPSTLADALNGAIDEALKAIEEFERYTPLKQELRRQ